MNVTGLLSRMRNRGAEPAAVPEPTTPSAEAKELVPLEVELGIGPADPLLAYLQTAAVAVDISRLTLESPALEQLRQAGVMVVVPLVSQGELIGTINLGARRSEQEYSSDDRKLLSDLAVQAAPAVRVAQMVQQQRQEARERERIEQELRVARLIQQTLLPQSLPDIAGWQVAAHYQPAREVGGDFYDFLYFDDGRVGFVIGDVTDKGVPAALVMATTRTLLRAAAERLISPGLVLERVNEQLHQDIPPKMFVTCMVAVLDPAIGKLVFANAGHDLPYQRGLDGVTELRATGMPLGLMPGMRYEEKQITLAPGDTVLFYSDGLAEAHDPQGEMFGFPRLRSLLDRCTGDPDLIACTLGALDGFTGPGWEQEDDVTLVTLHCDHLPEPVQAATGQEGEAAAAPEAWHSLAEFSIPSEPGNERQAMEMVAAVVMGGTTLGPASVERLKTAVAEATMNAMEHGNQHQLDVPVTIQVLASTGAVRVRIVDQGGGQFRHEAETPDLEAKLAGLQSPRGWGLFLIEAMVDEMSISSDDRHHIVDLVMRLEPAQDAA